MWARNGAARDAENLPLTPSGGTASFISRSETPTTKASTIADCDGRIRTHCIVGVVERIGADLAEGRERFFGSQDNAAAGYLVV